MNDIMPGGIDSVTQNILDAINGINEVLKSKTFVPETVRQRLISSRSALSRIAVNVAETAGILEWYDETEE